MAFRRKLIFQPDIYEWIHSNRGQIASVCRANRKAEKGFVAYMQDFRDFFKKPEKPEKPEKLDKPAETSGSSAVDQYYESEELIKTMKWKRVTWDEDADYTRFSKRILNNSNMFKSVPSFSYMAMHVIKDPLTSNFVNIPRGEKNVALGDLTNLFLRERDPTPVQQYIPTSTTKRLNPFSVDWTSGTVTVLDTASAREIRTFLVTTAKRVQAVQQQMELQQEKLTKDLEYVRVRAGATVKFNSNNTSFWDDPKRKTETNYVNPEELEQFLSGMLKSPLLYRWLMKGAAIRVMPPGACYYADTEKNELHIPSNFVDFNWVHPHTRFQGIERVASGFRRFKWFWFAGLLVVIGDVNIL